MQEFEYTRVTNGLVGVNIGVLMVSIVLDRLNRFKFIWGWNFATQDEVFSCEAVCLDGCLCQSAQIINVALALARLKASLPLMLPQPFS